MLRRVSSQSFRLLPETPEAPARYVNVRKKNLCEPDEQMDPNSIDPKGALLIGPHEGALACSARA